MPEIARQFWREVVRQARPLLASSRRLPRAIRRLPVVPVWRAPLAQPRYVRSDRRRARMNLNGVRSSLFGIPSPFGGRRTYTQRIQSLFLGGTRQGWFLDAEDEATMFEDAAGTIPVVGVEKPVGLWLDKSKGLALGAELVTTPYTGSVSGTWAVNSTSVTRNASTTGQATVNLNAFPVIGKVYLISFTVAGLSGDTMGLRFAGHAAAYQISANGTYTYRFTSQSTAGTLVFIPWTGSAGEATITNISVREIAGNHAYQTTSAARPVRSARYNLLTKTEAFGDAIWQVFNGVTKTGASATADPNGGSNAYEVAMGATGGAISSAGALFQTFSAVVGTTYDFSIWLRAKTGTTSVRLSINNSAADAATADLPLTTTWTRFNLTRTAAGTGTGNVCVRNNVAGNGGDILVWGADLRPANDGVGLPAYQRVNTSTDYDTVGFPKYVVGDGATRWMQTASIDFSGTDEITAFVGVRKTTDVTRKMLFELSASVAANSGTFNIEAPNNATTKSYRSTSKGTIEAIAERGTVGQAAPSTNIVTVLAKIGTPIISLYVDQVLQETDTGSQGTGNYGNYPLYLFSRGGTSLFSDGRIYQSICVGALLTAAEIANTNALVNSKVKAY